VTLVSSDKEAAKFTFRFEPAEREWFRHILDMYPVQQTPLKPINEDPGANELLGKALADGRKKLQEEADVFLKAGKLEIDPAFNEFWDLTLQELEIEELLQILNNVRVGLWLRLGKPEPSIEELLPKEPSEDQVRAHMVMHVCAAWQGTLMSAVGGTGETEGPQESQTP
jgi:hypothetical protein